MVNLMLVYYGLKRVNDSESQIGPHLVQYAKSDLVRLR